MECVLIGLRRAGKTTVFNILAGPEHEVHLTDGASSHIVSVQVPDPHFEELYRRFAPPKCVRNTLLIKDTPPVGTKETEKTKGLTERELQFISSADTLILVARCFSETGEEMPSPVEDTQSLWEELVLSDLLKAESRLDKIEKTVSKVSGTEKEQMETELAALKKVINALQEGKGARVAPLDQIEEKAIRGFLFLTQKPILVVANVGENDIGNESNYIALFQAIKGMEAAHLCVLCGKIESEIAQLDEDTRRIFLQDYGLKNPARTNLIHACYATCDLITFYTINEKELHAWAIPQGTPALTAAGMIHSDFEKGFIRAEVIDWKALIDAGGHTEARKKGFLRTEGKQYAVRDGEVINFLFKV